MAWITVNFSSGGGTGGQTASIYANTRGPYYDRKTAAAQYIVSNVRVPTLSGRLFCGYDVPYGGYRIPVANERGVVLINSLDTSSATTYTATATWSSYATVTIDAGAGVGGTDVVYISMSGGVYSDSALTSRIHSVQLPVTTTKSCSGIWIGENQFADAEGNITQWGEAFVPELGIVSASAVYVEKIHKFGDVTDWFGLASDWLVPESSSGGEEVRRVDPSNSGTMSNSVGQTGSAVWLNPTVTYRVVGNGTLDVTLGSAFAAFRESTAMANPPTRTGYMITSVTVSTELGSFPSVTVSAVANEGYVRSGNNSQFYTMRATPAINSFRFQVAILARARAQNLMGCMSADPEALHELTLTASCTPVVLDENLLPCASDVVDGLLSVQARVMVYGQEAAPAGANGFSSAGMPESEGGTSYMERTVALRKAM